MARRTLVAAVVVGGLAVGATGCGGKHGVAISVTPASATVDVPFAIRVDGLRPRQRIVLAFSGRSPSGARWRGHQQARANRSGVVSLPDDFVLARMRGPGREVGAFPRRVRVAVDVRGGVQVAASAERDPVSFASLKSTFESPLKVGFFARWDRPRGVRHHTAILLFGGSEGGLSESDLVTTLVAHGYPVLHLAYFREPGLPQDLTRIPLEYFRHALRWLAAQPEVDPRRIVTFGISRGGELSLLLASTFPQLVRAAVGYVPFFEAVPSPSDPDEPAWTFHGDPVLGVIPVERIAGPVFVAGGDQDGLWQSGLSVELIAQRLHDHGRRDVTALEYPNAGHALGFVLPVQTPISARDYGIVDSQYGVLDLGGSPKADEAAREDAWPKLLAFLARVGG